VYVQDLTKAAGFSIALAAQMIAYAKQTIISVLQLTSWAADSYKKEENSFT